MKSFIEFIEETDAGDIASVSSKLGTKPVKRAKPCTAGTTEKECNEIDVIKLKEKTETPADILRDNGIKIKAVEMDDDSYVIMLFKKSEVKESKEILEGEGYEISIVGSMLYIH